MKAEKFVKILGGKTCTIYPPEEIERIVGEVEAEEIGVKVVLSKYSISLNTL